MSDKHIYTLETLKRMARDVRSQGKTVGLTHGAFDLFHVSHLDLLKKASKRCDFLIVGVDSDANIAKYKSYKRPIINQEDRMKIIFVVGSCTLFLMEIDFAPARSACILARSSYPKSFPLKTKSACISL